MSQRYAEFIIEFTNAMFGEDCVDIEFPVELVGTEDEQMFEEHLNQMGYEWFPSDEEEESVPHLYYTVCRKGKNSEF